MTRNCCQRELACCAAKRATASANKKRTPPRIVFGAMLKERWGSDNADVDGSIGRRRDARFSSGALGPRAINPKGRNRKPTSAAAKIAGWHWVLGSANPGPSGNCYMLAPESLDDPTAFRGRI